MTSVHPLRHTPRQREPEVELDFARSPALGYEAPQEVGWVRCLAHGFPSPLARWHCHDEYELHLITGTSGKAFVGDWIGPFSPGHLVLCGPRLPHNWISLDAPDGAVERDLVIQFQHGPFEQAARHVPELADCAPLLERASHGIEFFGLSQRAGKHWNHVKHSRGLRRLAAFCEYLSDLAECVDYRLLSNVQIKGGPGGTSFDDEINAVVNRVTADAAEPISLAEVAASVGMSESRLSRFFRRATGNTFTDFVNRVRINNACHLLMQTDHLVTDICYSVGFNNVANFNRRFLEIKGMTLTEFRRQTDRRFGGSA